MMNNVKNIFVMAFFAVVLIFGMTNTTQAYAGEDPWDMMDRLLYHSGSWLVSGHGAANGEMIQKIVQITEINNCSPESEYADGVALLVPGLEGEQYADFILLGGRVISFQHPGTNKAILQMKRL